MENFFLENDIRVFYVTASAFPTGVLDAHEKLHLLIPFSEKRKYFGVSRPEGTQGIVYRAAAEELEDGEGKKVGCETLVLKKGIYTSIVLHDYLKDVEAIGRAFLQLLHNPGIDPEGYCVEWYLSQDVVKCMVRLK